MEKNTDIRLELARNKVPKQEVAKELGIAQPTFSHWLNDAEMPEWKKILVWDAIKAVAKRQKGDRA